ncbi:hypothetical protein SNOG_13352 [Parastagonospora nodorum SN15]|uniref:Uncharacterized protein n=1 Tax=Phaeosphaeria nodorum (strain SN15 / ATCC MYA-4574 / FGSC 10173) TaxID=321614 RepID=Q0U4G2_PHANO|nr:hypothetical protein SNOG_13352 [Parastagonospora nodorum SN15]EAT79236.1 hypothetical protein SNOG_13352 [Parastagonospora nodorum SN15]
MAPLPAVMKGESVGPDGIYRFTVLVRRRRREILPGAGELEDPMIKPKE